MKKRFLVEVDYDPDNMHGDDPEAIDWFYNQIMRGNGGELLLHSNELGTTIGAVTVLELMDGPYLPAAARLNI